MGVLLIILLFGCAAVWVAGLKQSYLGQPKSSLLGAAAAVVLGIVTIIAVTVLPREAFGELGHGDGMGLIGLYLFGAVGVGTGLIASLVTGIIYAVGHKSRVGSVEE